ncbi:hypothetical protein B0H10DRAFT_2186884 [Mycena sp. CBHHK59/15]|nr:hypothetical protein B0H10DRAFT_2186884 [Mycena sp. CBHHK59/15]
MTRSYVSSPTSCKHHGTPTEWGPRRREDEQDTGSETNLKCPTLTTTTGAMAGVTVGANPGCKAHSYPPPPPISRQSHRRLATGSVGKEGIDGQDVGGVVRHGTEEDGSDNILVIRGLRLRIREQKALTELGLSPCLVLRRMVVGRGGGGGSRPKGVIWMCSRDLFGVEHIIGFPRTSRVHDIACDRESGTHGGVRRGNDHRERNCCKCDEDEEHSESHRYELRGDKWGEGRFASGPAPRPHGSHRVKDAHGYGSTRPGTGFVVSS